MTGDHFLKSFSFLIRSSRIDRPVKRLCKRITWVVLFMETDSRHYKGRIEKKTRESYHSYLAPYPPT